MLGKAHRQIYFFALLALAIALPTSKAAVNVMGGVLLGNWLLEWNWKEKWQRLRACQSVLVFAAFFLSLAWGFCATDSLSGSLRSWLSKVPFLLPIVIATTEKISISRQRFLLWAFSITVLIMSALSLGWMMAHGTHDIRDGGLFISHIRFSICAALAVLFDFYFVQKLLDNRLKAETIPLISGISDRILLWTTVVMAILIALYLFVVQIFTGIILLFVMAFLLFLRQWCVQNVTNGHRILMALAALVCVWVIADFTFVTFRYFHYDSAIERDLPTFTQQGHSYRHDIHSLVENGSKIGLFVCEEELADEWSKRSDVQYDTISQTLIRYLNSKHLRKDAGGVRALSAQDVRHIESGLANVDYAQRFGLRKMLYPTYFSFSLYQREGIVLNSSVLQRVELWKHSWRAVKARPWSGYGLGRHKAALDAQLDMSNSPLRRNMGCHNQFLSYLLMGGIPLLVAFLLFYFAPLVLLHRRISFPYFLFWLALFLSLFAEDTLETGSGLYLYIFFSAFWLFGSSEEVV